MQLRRCSNYVLEIETKAYKFWLIYKIGYVSTSSYQFSGFGPINQTILIHGLNSYSMDNVNVTSSRTFGQQIPNGNCELQPQASFEALYQREREWTRAKSRPSSDVADTERKREAHPHNMKLYVHWVGWFYVYYPWLSSNSWRCSNCSNRS